MDEYAGKLICCVEKRYPVYTGCGHGEQIPPHYNKAGVECIDAIAAATGDGYEYYLQGNIMKYLWRYRYKNGTEDLKKAQMVSSQAD